MNRLRVMISDIQHSAILIIRISHLLWASLVAAVVYVGAAEVEADHRFGAFHVLPGVSPVDFLLCSRAEAGMALTGERVVREAVLVLLLQRWPFWNAQRHRFPLLLAVQLSRNLCLHLGLEIHPEVVQPHGQLGLAP